MRESVKPGTAEIRSALEKVLSSESFAQAARLREFLRFIVEETLAGRGDRLKGYTIGTEVFEKPEDFDARSDPHVRVEAGRLRQRLADYYLSEGAADRVRIEVRRGSYRPEFVYASVHFPDRTAPESTIATTPAFARLPARLGIAVLVAVAIVVVGLAYFYARNPAVENTQANGSELAGPAHLGVETFENIGDPQFDYFAYGLTEEILVRLGGYLPSVRLFDVYREDDLDTLGIDEAPPDYRLTGTVARLEDSVRVTVRLLDARTGVELWTANYNDALALGSLLRIQETIASTVATTLSEPLGPIIDAEVGRAVERPAGSLGAYDCLLRYLYATRTLARSEQAIAKGCLERGAAAGALDFRGWTALSLLYRWEYEGGYDLLDGTEPAIDRAREAAERALDLDGSDYEPYYAMALAKMASHDYPGAIDATEHALSLDPPAAARAVLGINLIRQGEGERGMRMITAAIEESPRRTPYFFIGPTIYYIGARDYEAALRSADRIDAPDFIMARVFTAALSAHLGLTDRTDREIELLLAAHPRFPEYGRALVERWSFGPSVEAALIEGLMLAGVGLS